MPSSHEYAYMAGLLDGDGCITIGRHPASGKNKIVRFGLQLIVASATRGLCDWPHAKFGGNVFEQANGSFAWRMNGKPVAALLTECLPYFVEKRPQAELAISLQDLKNEKGAASTHRQEAIYEKLRALHLRPGTGRRRNLV